MKSRTMWQCAAIISLSLFFIGCKKDIKETNKPIQEDGSSSTLGITCIPNGIQFFKQDSLSQARGSDAWNNGPLGTGLTNKILIVGGLKNDDNLSERVDIYNTTTNTWTDKILSSRRWEQALAAAGTKIGIAGGENPYSGSGSTTDRVDIYDVNSDIWTVSHLSSPRIGIAGVGYGNFLYFAGGTPIVKTIDVYNTITGVWSILKLPHARMYAAAAATDNKIVFAGGVGSSGNRTNVADIYDVPTGTWSVGHLSQARERLAATALGNVIIFAGGEADPNFYNTIDMYNTTTGIWTVAQVPNAPYARVQAAAQGTKMFFGRGGNSSGPTNISVYDICSNTWGSLFLTDGRADFGIGAAGGKVLFGGGDINGKHSKAADIFSLGPLIAQ
jgi:Galactose oxidase, central domain